ncbi:hypothetical protein [Herbaspirillum sp. YR522]|uniref:hypothetical protein n=1 Tax=Herbaspirillum sp. YR522 TaxID=1144342 RepID=UPI0012FCE393|nr:hypothetical protein [Herbaspirillum sp. YR522]
MSYKVIGLPPIESATAGTYLTVDAIADLQHLAPRLTAPIGPTPQDRINGRQVDRNVIEETVMDKLVLGWLLGVPVVMLVLLQYLI